MEQHEKSKEGLTKHRNANYKCHSCKKCFEEIEHLGTINVKHWGKTKEQVPKKILKYTQNKSLLNKISRGKYLQC